MRGRGKPVGGKKEGSNGLGEDGEYYLRFLLIGAG